MVRKSIKVWGIACFQAKLDAEFSSYPENLDRLTKGSEYHRNAFHRLDRYLHADRFLRLEPSPGPEWTSRR